MKKREIKTIDLGETFYENKKINNDYPVYDYKTLFDCYNNPSYRKYNIYEYYENLLKDNCDAVLNYGVRSFNSMVIVLHAEIIKDNKKYYLVITPKYNHFKEI